MGGCCRTVLPSKPLGIVDDADLTPTVDAALEKSKYLFNQLARLDLSYLGPEGSDQVSRQLETDMVAQHDQGKAKAPLRPSTVEVPVAWIEELASVLGRLREIEKRSGYDNVMCKLIDFKCLPAKRHIQSQVRHNGLQILIPATVTWILGCSSQVEMLNRFESRRDVRRRHHKCGWND